MALRAYAPMATEPEGVFTERVPFLSRIASMRFFDTSICLLCLSSISTSGFCAPEFLISSAKVPSFTMTAVSFDSSMLSGLSTTYISTVSTFPSTLSMTVALPYFIPAAVAVLSASFRLYVMPPSVI